MPIRNLIVRSGLVGGLTYRFKMGLGALATSAIFGWMTRKHRRRLTT